MTKARVEALAQKLAAEAERHRANWLAADGGRQACLHLLAQWDTPDPQTDGIPLETLLPGAVVEPA